MTASDLQSLQYAGQLIELARGEETATGNPLAAARHYVTAMESIISLASKHAAGMEDLNKRRVFLCQVRSRTEVYYERAELLLQVAAETGLLDKPGQGGGLRAALPGPSPSDAAAGGAPTLYGGNLPKSAGGDVSCSGAAGRPNSAVMGIPLPPQSQPQPQPPQTDDCGAGAGANFYIKPSGDGGASAAPPPPAQVDLDDLMRQLGAPKEP